MKKVLIYTMNFCPYCTRAKQLLESRGIAFEEELVSTEDIAKWEELEKRSGMKTMPQIFIEDKCIGGFQELDAADRSGELPKLLA